MLLDFLINGQYLSAYPFGNVAFGKRNVDKLLTSVETINFVVEYPSESIKWLDVQFEDNQPCDSTFPNMFQKYFYDMTLDEFLSKHIVDKVFQDFENACIQYCSKLSPEQLESVYRNLMYLDSCLDYFIDNKE